MDANQSAAAPAPKLDLKMLVIPIIFLFQKKIDFTDPNVVNLARTGLVCAIVIALSTYAMIYFAIEKKNDRRKIWVPPKVPSLPFLGTVGEPPKPEDYVATTYYDHETKLLKEAAQGALMSCGIAVFMSFKFNTHISCVMQTVMVPLGLFDLVLVKKHLLGNDVGKAYNELDASPVVAAPAVNNKAAKNKSSTSDDDKRPRVEELDDEDEVDNRPKVEELDDEVVDSKGKANDKSKSKQSTKSENIDQID
jgi:hypothetical protein